MRSGDQRPSTIAKYDDTYNGDQATFTTTEYTITLPDINGAIFSDRNEATTTASV